MVTPIGWSVLPSMPHCLLFAAMPEACECSECYVRAAIATGFGSSDCPNTHTYDYEREACLLATAAGSGIGGVLSWSE